MMMFNSNIKKQSVLFFLQDKLQEYETEPKTEGKDGKNN